MRRPLLACTLPISLALAAPCAAWGPEGHRIIGAIAEHYLDDTARKAVRELLDGQTLADVAFWADEVREQEEYEWTRPLHYINVPRDAERVDLKRDCETGRCVVQAIIDASQALRDPRRSRSQRTEALKFLVHFVGDIHQPMHVSYRDDLGGNRITLAFDGEETNLHRLWDRGLLRRRIGESHWRPLSSELIRGVSDEQAGQWAGNLDAVQWANESLQITRRIYRELQGPDAAELGEDYYRRNIDDVLGRLTMAGVRLAAVLNAMTEDGKQAP